MKKLGIIALALFMVAWAGVGCFFLFPGCSYSKMAQTEITEEYRFYTVKVKQNEMLVVFLLAKHEQDLSWIKANADYDIISVDKTYRRRHIGRFSSFDDEAIKVYLMPKQSFLLNWSYITNKEVKNVLYTKIELQ